MINQKTKIRIYSCLSKTKKKSYCKAKTKKEGLRPFFKRIFLKKTILNT